MTYAGKFGHLLHDIVQESGHAGQRDDRTISQSEIDASSDLRLRSPIDPRCAALLASILGSQAGAATPCVQFVACEVTSGACAIAFGVAQSAAYLTGRTLLLNTRACATTRLGLVSAFETPNQADCSPLSDAFTPRLYHYAITPGDSRPSLLYGRNRKDMFETLAASFRLTVIETGPPHDDPAACALAQFCFGSVLVVKAGVSALTSVKDAARRIGSAGGAVIGTVLSEAPDDLPGWIKDR